jgi:hypothetical protein
VAGDRRGDGTVQRYDVTVPFDHHGYRDLLVRLLVARRPLRAAR